MKPANILRLAGWILFLVGATIVFFIVGGLDEAVKQPLGWAGIAGMLVGVACNIVSTLLRLWPRKYVPPTEEDDAPSSGSTPSE